MDQQWGAFKRNGRRIKKIGKGLSVWEEMTLGVVLNISKKNMSVCITQLCRQKCIEQ